MTTKEFYSMQILVNAYVRRRANAMVVCGQNQKNRHSDNVDGETAAAHFRKIRKCLLIQKVNFYNGCLE